MPEKGPNPDASTVTEPSFEASGEDIGALAVAAAVTASHADSEESVRGRAARQRSVPTGLWPDMPGVFFPEPYAVDFTWIQGPPEAVTQLRAEPSASRPAVATPSQGQAAASSRAATGAESEESERTLIDLEAEDLEPLELESAELMAVTPEGLGDSDSDNDSEDLALESGEVEALVIEPEGEAERRETTPMARPKRGPDSIQPLTDADLEEVAEATTKQIRAQLPPGSAPAPGSPPTPATTVSTTRVTAQIAPPVPAPSVDPTKPIRAVKLGGGKVYEEARVMPLERIRALRRVQGPRPTRAQPNLIEAALGADTSQTSSMSGGRPWYEVIFDDSYFLSLPKNLHRQTRKDAKFIWDSLRLADGARILDVACGFGRHALELAKRGYRVTGIDLSRPLIDKAKGEAKRRQTEIDFVIGDVREISYEADFDGAICLGQSFGLFDDETNFDVLQRMATSLRPRGRLLLQILNRDRLIRELPEVIWWRGQDCLILEEIELDAETSRMCAKRTIVFDDGRSPWEQYIEIRLYSLHEIYSLMDQAGLRVLDISGSTHHPGLFFLNESRDIYLLGERERRFT